MRDSERRPNGSASRPGDRRPDILIIHTDEHRIDCLGAYGNRQISTPNLDALAARGVRYDNSFCPFPVCTPSRYSLLSGLYVHQHRGWNNRSTPVPGTAMFPAMLKSAGYRTAAVGKMHFTPTYLDVGFERMILAEQDGPGRWDDDYHRYLRDLGLVDYNDLEDQVAEYRKDARPEYWETFGALVSNLPEEHHSTTWIGDRAVETLEGWGGGGNLLMVGFIKPHHPFDPPSRWAEMYDPDAVDPLPGWAERLAARDTDFHKAYFPDESLTEPAIRRITAYYYATISHIDHHVGRMIDVLKRTGRYDDALIVLTSDHGDYVGAHHMVLKGGAMYDPLVKVPLIVKFPGGRRAGEASTQLVNNVDLAPTILAQTGCEPAAAMRGLDLAADTDGHEIVFAEARHLMARSAGRKLLLREPREKSLLFDLQADPLEMNNLFAKADRADEIRRLEEAIGAWCGDDYRPFDKYVDVEAPRIEAANVPPIDDEHRREMMAYYAEMMRARPGGGAGDAT